MSKTPERNTNVNSTQQSIVYDKGIDLSIDSGVLSPVKKSPLIGSGEKRYRRTR